MGRENCTSGNWQGVQSSGWLEHGLGTKGFMLGERTCWKVSKTGVSRNQHGGRTAWEDQVRGRFQQAGGEEGQN